MALKNPFLACLIVLAILGIPVLGAPLDAQASQTARIDDGPWVVRAYDGTPAMIGELVTRFSHIGSYPTKDFVVVQIDSRSEFDQLIAEGFRIEVDQEETSTLRRINTALASGRSFSTIPGFDCYRTVEETLATGAALAAAHPTLATWTDIGDTWEKVNAPPAGFDVMVLVLTNQAIAGPKPKLLVTGSTHPRELSTAELVTRFAEHLVGNYNADPDVTWLLDHHEIHLILMLNPDGRKRAETGLSWRKNANNDFCTDSNSRGIDLNRNLSFQWGACNGSSGSACSLTFRGPSAASEPEAQALEAYMRAIFPDQRSPALTAPAPDDATGVYFDIHSFGRVVLSTWGCQVTNPPHPNGDQVLRLGRKYGYFPNYGARLGSIGAVDGTTKDFSFGELGVPGYTAELGTTFFEGCGYFESAIVDDNIASLIHMAKNSRTPYMTPAGPDAVDVAIPPTAVAAGNNVQVSAQADDTRYDNSNAPPEPTQNITAAEAYINVPPWNGGATALPMQAADGTFDEQIEDVTATLDTTGLATGRHTVFVRGRDADDNWGAFSAAFLFVIDPLNSPSLEGRVLDATDGSPVSGTVFLEPLSANSSPGTGSYSLQVPSGSYSVRVTADGFASESDSLTLSDGETVFRDFRLLPLSTIFDDDVEGGNAGWTAQAPWAMVTETANSPTHSWADSPGGNYGNNTDTSLTSPLFDLSNSTGSLLTFWHRYDFEEDFDFGLVEISTDGGSTWQQIASFTGENQTIWRQESYPVPMLDGINQARVRFRVDTDTSSTADGWHVDDVLLEAAAQTLIFADGFESGDTSAW